MTKVGSLLIRVFRYSIYLVVLCESNRTRKHFIYLHQIVYAKSRIQLHEKRIMTTDRRWKAGHR